MRHYDAQSRHQESSSETMCAPVQERFSAYLDGAVTGVEMTAIAVHLEACEACTTEFAAWRSVQATLTQMRESRMPARLQQRLRTALAAERERGTHLPLSARFHRLWAATLAPLALRVSGGLAAAMLLAGGLGWAFGAPFAVQANDDRMAHLVAPRYLYSLVPPQAITTRHETSIVLDAKVDSAGRVYDFEILNGPRDAKTVVQVENNLLTSVFAPATVFGEPVPDHIVMIYAAVSARQ